ncbi:MAG: hypothetical protein FWD47_07365 [Treponema sp.]|nr:hypothetical protein [Treponema sp.]
MKKIILSCLIISLLFFGCSGKNDSEEKIDDIPDGITDYFDDHIITPQDGNFGQTEIIRIYHYHESLTNSDFTYQTVELPGNNFLANAINYLNTNTGLRVKNIWYEGTRLLVDFDPVMISRFEGQGTSGAFQLSNEIFRCFSSFPNVKEMKFLFDGKEDLMGDHFSFQGIYPAGSFIRIDSGAEEPNIIGLWERENDSFHIYNFLADNTYKEGRKESSWDRIGRWDLYGRVLTITIESGAYHVLEVPIIERYNITIVHEDMFFWLDKMEEIIFIRSDYIQ